MLPSNAPAVASSAATERKEAPGDSAGGPSAGSAADMPVPPVPDGAEWPAQKQTPAGGDASIEMGPEVLVRNEHGQGSAMTPHDDGDRGVPAPLIIPQDATLVDGLRALLVHHLKRSIGSDMVSLSASQAELLEHHLARLASYAQKIVHTLAFATRFLSKQSDCPDGFPSNPQEFAGAGASRSPISHHRHDEGNGASSAADVQPEPKAPRKNLKLSDDEILSIYRSAQAEAAIEADWRGVEGPAPIGQGYSAEGDDGTNRSGGPSPAPPDDTPELSGGDREYLKMLSRALQEPGGDPRALTAEILDPSSGVVCCRPGGSTTKGGRGDLSALHGISSTPNSRQDGH